MSFLVLYNICMYVGIYLLFSIFGYFNRKYVTKNLKLIKTIDDIPIYEDNLTKQISPNSFIYREAYSTGSLLFYQSYFVVLDENLSNRYPNEKYFIIEHELSHIRRHHIFFLVITIFLFNFISDTIIRENIKNDILFFTIVSILFSSLYIIITYFCEIEADIVASKNLTDSQLENGINFFNKDREDHLIPWLLNPYPSENIRIEYLKYCLKERQMSIFHYLLNYYIRDSIKEYYSNNRNITNYGSINDIRYINKNKS